MRILITSPREINMPQHKRKTLTEEKQRWEKEKKKKQQVIKKCRATNDKQLRRYATRMENCSTVMKTITNHNGHKTIQSQNLCRVRICPVCAWRKTSKQIAINYPTLSNIKELYPDAVFLFLTVTVKNCDINKVRTSTYKIRDGWRKIWLKLKKKYGALGYLMTMEIGRAENGHAHPHAHIVLMLQSQSKQTGFLNIAFWGKVFQLVFDVPYTPQTDIKIVDKLKNLNYYMSKSDLHSNKLLNDSDFLFGYLANTRKLRSFSSGGLIKSLVAQSKAKYQSIKKVI